MFVSLVEGWDFTRSSKIIYINVKFTCHFVNFYILLWREIGNFEIGRLRVRYGVMI